MTKESLPPFAAEWMKQWKNAAIELQKVRDRELAEMDSTTQIVSEL